MSEAVSDDLVLRDLLEPALLAKNIPFREFIEPGRKNVECFPLYTTEQTGPDGPTAMLVRYRPSATNQRHIHTGYELILVLDGELEDDHGTYGRGSMIVSPPGSSHAAFSTKGCTVLIVWEKPVQRVPNEA